MAWVRRGISAPTAEAHAAVQASYSSLARARSCPSLLGCRATYAAFLALSKTVVPDPLKRLPVPRRRQHASRAQRQRGARLRRTVERTSVGFGNRRVSILEWIGKGVVAVRASKLTTEIFTCKSGGYRHRIHSDAASTFDLESPDSRVRANTPIALVDVAASSTASRRGSRTQLLRAAQDGPAVDVRRKCFQYILSARKSRGVWPGVFEYPNIYIWVCSLQSCTYHSHCFAIR